jgi:O-antigen/teichoic acid export membrane protein
MGKLAELVTLVVMATVLPRALGPSDFGYFSGALTLVTLVALAMTLGGPTTMARYVPAADPSDRRLLARRLGMRLAKGRGIQLAVLTVVAGAVAAVAPDRVSPGVAAIVFVALALNVVASLELQVGLGLGRTAFWSARFPLQNACLVLAVLVLYPVAGRTSALLGIAAAALAAAALGAVVVAPVLSPPDRPVPLPAGAVRFGALHAGGAALNQFVQRGGVLAVALLAGAGAGAETGYCAVALGIALGITYAVLQAFTVALPHLSTADRPVEAAEDVLRRFATRLLAVLTPIALLVAVVLPALVPAVFGSEYGDATAAFVPAIALVLVSPLTSFTVQCSALRLRPEVPLVAGLVGVAVFVVVAVLAVPPLGAAGGTAAALGASLTAGSVSAALLATSVGVALPAATVGAVALVLAAGVAVQ